jgi:chromo domain-containing protein 1
MIDTNNVISLEKLYVLLTDSGYCEPDGTFDHPVDNRRLDFFPVISMRQTLAEDVGLYYEARKHSQYEANTDMAHHYSGLVVTERRNYRHYFVVHTNPEMVDWKETIMNIDEIITPEKCVEYFEQEPKGCKFDNFEWSYPAKKADSLTASVTGSPVQNSQCATCGLNSAECPCRWL